MRIGITAVLAVASATAVAGLAGAGTAAAAAIPSQPHSTEVTAAIIKADSIAGYVTRPGPSTVTARFKVPDVRCSTVNSGINIGAYLEVGVGNSSGADVLVACVDGETTYEAQAEINGSGSTVFTVNPDDVMTVTVSETVAGTTVKIEDLTTGDIAKPTGAGGGALGVFVGTGGVALDGTPLPNVPKFKSIPFTHVRVDGHSLRSAGPVKVERVDGSVVQIVPGAITGGGTAVRMIFKHD